MKIKKIINILFILSFFANTVLADENLLDLDKKEIKEMRQYLTNSNIHQINKNNQKLISQELSDINVNDITIAKANQKIKELYPDLSNNNKILPDNKNNGLIIFLSSSLPDNIMQQYQVEIKKYSAKAVFRGMIDNSMAKTVAYINDIKNRQVGISIDPKLFAKFNITKAPTLILYDVNSCKNNQCTPLHDKITGTVPIKYFLEKISQEGDLSDIAQKILINAKTHE